MNTKITSVKDRFTITTGVLKWLLLIFRTALKEQTLQLELEGHADYARRVRYRLLSGGW